MIRQTYYIGTGRKSAMFTLRVQRSGDGLGFVRDSYVCNLAGIDNEELAINKGRERADAMRERIGETDNFKVEFKGVWDEPCNRRRGKLSVRDTANIERIEDGVFPFGKHAGTRIADAPDGYVLFFADKMNDQADAVTFALAAACQGVALERGLIAKRDAARAERAALDAKSQHVGTVGERREFDAEVVAVINRVGDYNIGEMPFQMTKLRVGNDLIVYFGLIGKGDLMKAGDRIRFKATVKRHSEREGVKSTVVQRPKVL